MGLCDGLGKATGQLGTNAEERFKVEFNILSLNKVMSDKTKVEKSTNADYKSVSQPIAKPNVVRSPKMSTNKGFKKNLIKKLKDSGIPFSEKLLLNVDQPSELLIDLIPISQV